MNRLENALNLVLFLGVRLVCTLIISNGLMNILFVVNPLYRWAPSIGDGVSEFGIGIFLFLCLMSARTRIAEES